jgi:hypothetical protein
MDDFKVRRIGLGELLDVRDDDVRLEARARELREEVFDRREPWKKRGELHVM